MPSFQAVFFDLYGTLIHLTQETKPYRRLFTEIGLTTPEEFQRARKIALTEDFENLAQLVRRITPEANAHMQGYEQEVASEVASARTYPETRQVLEELKRRNIKLALISNLASPYKEPLFALQLDTFFDAVIFSCEVGASKPDPRVYEKALQILKIEPSHALMVGDKIHCDVEPPKARGTDALLVDRDNNYSGPHQKINTLEGVLEYTA